MHIQVRNCCIIALTNLPLQVKKTRESQKKKKKLAFPETHTQENQWVAV